MRRIAPEEAIGALCVPLGIAGRSKNRRLNPLVVRDSAKQIVQRQRLTLGVFRKGFPCHAANHIALAGKAFLPGVFVGERRQDLGCNSILLIFGQGADFFQRLLFSRVDMLQ